MLMETNSYTASTWSLNLRVLWNRCGMYRDDVDSPPPPPLRLSTTRTENDEGRPIATNLKPSFSLA